MLEELSKYDDELLERLLEGDNNIEVEIVKRTVRKAVLSQQVRSNLRVIAHDMQIFPVFCGAASRNRGVQPVLDAVTDYLPSPYDVTPAMATVKDTEGAMALFEFQLIHNFVNRNSRMCARNTK